MPSPHCRTNANLPESKGPVTRTSLPVVSTVPALTRTSLGGALKVNVRGSAALIALFAGDADFKVTGASTGASTGRTHRNPTSDSDAFGES